MSEDQDRKKDGDASPRPPAQSFFMDDLSFAADLEGKIELPLPPDTEQFRFVSEIGRGGMGVVYKAEDLVAQRPVAIKLVHPGLGLSPAARERFEREARTAASIHHDRCVFVYGAHRIEGMPAIAMELMTGETLADRVEAQGAIDTVTALAWIEDVLDGLEAAHEAGVIHRDIKPSNLFLDEHGRLKIGDFGLSRPESGDLSLTRSGMYLGSPLYCSPEQARGRDVDTRSDIYSVGATLYALLAGHPPFVSNNIGDLFARIATEEPKPLRSLNSSLPIGLDRVVMKAMAKDPKDRFRSAREMRIALAAYQPANHSNAALGLRGAAFVVDAILLTLVSALIEFIYSFTMTQFEAPESLTIQLGNGASEFRNLIGAFLFVLYFTGFECWFGSTPGKFLFGLRVVREGGGRPPLRSGLLRSSFFIIEEAIVIATGGRWRMAAGLVNLLAAVTMRRRNGFRGLHEFISGTRTVAVRSRARRLIERRNAFDPRRTEDPARPVTPPGGYEVVARVAAVDEHELLLVNDPRLGRNVWLVRDEAVRQDVGTDLRWLDGPPGWAVFEDPGGASLFAYARQRPDIEWTRLRDYLLELADIFGGDDKAAFARLWIDRRGHIRQLPFAITPDGAPPTTQVEGFIASVRAITGGDTRRWVDDLPEGGSNFLKRVRNERQPFETPQEARLALLALGEPGERPSRGQRVAHFMFNTLGIIVGSGLILTLGAFAIDLKPDDDHLILNPPFITALYVVGLVIPNMLLSAFFRGGPVLTLLNLRLFDRGGERASAKRAAMRTLVTHLPVLLTALFCVAFRGPIEKLVHIEDAALAAIFGTGIIFSGLCFLYALIRPTHSLADFVTGTHLTHLSEATSPEESKA